MVAADTVEATRGFRRVEDVERGLEVCLPVLMGAWEWVGAVRESTSSGERAVSYNEVLEVNVEGRERSAVGLRS